MLLVILLGQYANKINKPLFPPLVTDPTSRSIIIIAGLIISLIVLYKILRKFNEP
jgi:hypothetical protein